MENVRRFMERFGLPGPVPNELLPLGDAPEPQVGHGLGVTSEAATDLAALAADPSAWLRLSDARVEREGYQVFRARDRPSVLLLHSEHGALEPVGHLDERSLAFESDVLIDLERFDPAECFAAVHAGSRAGGLLLVGQQLGLLPRPLEVGKSVPVRSPVRELAAELEEGWLRDEIERLCAAGGPLAEAAAMGLLARYRPLPSSRAGRGALIASLLAGETTPSLGRERRWARSLTGAERDSIEREAGARATGLCHDLEEVGDAPDPESARWRAAWLRVLHGRDTLEGVRVLLESAGPAHRLQATLRTLDLAGQLAVRALPRCREVADDSRLLEASVRSPEGWWTWPAHPELDGAAEREAD